MVGGIQIIFAAVVNNLFGENVGQENKGREK